MLKKLNGSLTNYNNLTRNELNYYNVKCDTKNIKHEGTYLARIYTNKLNK